ncbi:MAG: 2-oxoglutarate oxidoreductase [Firmicutes bacterium CAG:137_57_8]|nr:MAG: 2-oxoglutarate oxidoreductase [Firmicutes bacterium CAG:137_57_8]
MAIVYQKSKGLTDAELHYCPGCTHGIIHKLVAETLEEMDVLGNTIGVAPVGCSVFAYNYFNCDMHEAAHGRALVFTYQGDGDLAAIGTAEIIHAAMRGEKITTIFINNAIYGMTGGQMAPTTLVGQKATTAPLGRQKDHYGSPIRMAEIISTLEGCAYATRVCATDIPNLNKAKKAIQKAFRLQQEGAGFTFVEVLACCPTNWGKTPAASIEWLKENMIPYFPLGVYKDITAEVK